MRLPAIALRISRLLHALVLALQGRERLAGLVIERGRIRFAEFRAAVKRSAGTAPATRVDEGAVLFSKDAVQNGVLTQPQALIEALRSLLERGTPRPLGTANVILSLPLVRLVGQAVTIPQRLGRDEAEGALRLAAERILPFPLTEAYVDWEPLAIDDAHEHENSAAVHDTQSFLVVAAHRDDIDPYVHACEAAGLRPVAVEPITSSIARGLTPHPGATYIAVVQEDALLAAGLDASGNVRFLQHRKIPTMTDITARSTQERAERIVAELTSLIRFFRAEVKGPEYGLIVDGILDETTLRDLRVMANSLGVPLWIEEKAHELSRSAARGTALRAALPRSEDRSVSLMAVGTEEAYATRQSAFFLHAALRLIFGAAFIALLFQLGTLAFLGVVERSVRETAEQTSAPSPETLSVFEETERFNAAIRRVTSLLEGTTMPPGIALALMTSAPPGIAVERIAIDAAAEREKIRVDLSVRANRSSNLTAERDVLIQRFTDDPLTIPSDIFLTQGAQIPFVFSFTLRPNFQP